MRICVATYSSWKFESVRQLTEPNKVEYCQRHGYDFRSNPLTDKDSTASFDRYQWYLDISESNRWDWLYCLDADAIFTNMAKPLDSLIQKHDTLIFPMDAVTVQTGGFLARNCALSLTFFSLVFAHRNEGFADQHIVGQLLPMFKAVTRFSPQREFGSYDYAAFLRGFECVSKNYADGKDFQGNDGQWQPGDLILHVPGLPVKQKAEAIRPYLKRVAR